eukprot:scaffold38796_cov44-Prasinocladus_malaysianus.AAC.1
MPAPRPLLLLGGSRPLLVLSSSCLMTMWPAAVLFILLASGDCFLNFSWAQPAARDTWHSSRSAGGWIADGGPLSSSEPVDELCSEPAKLEPFYLYDFEVSRLCNPPDLLQRMQERAARPKPADRGRAMHDAIEKFTTTVRNFVMGTVLRSGAFNHEPNALWAPQTAK